MTGDAAAYNRLHAILDGARKLSGREREAYLDRSCGDDAQLRASVLEMLAAGSDEGVSDPFVEANAGSLHRELADLRETSASWLPERIGDYTIRRQIGQGGMGVVYEAQQDSPRRRVAIKLLNPMRATPERLRRFRREAALLGRLQHPGIAQIFEAGTFDAGRVAQPFFAMELVEGVDLRTYCDRQALDRAARLELLARVADAVQYAHERGVIHRDLKPDNVLVDELGNPRILDFGIARANTHSTTLSTLVTEEGLLGTLAYMAPEQLSEAGVVTPQVDVFALGVLGFELLLGRLPREIEDLPAPRAIAVLARLEPARASALDPSLRGDVETMLGKALETDPRRRYASAAALAGDLRRYLADRPIRAHPPSTAYRVHKFVRRNRGLVGGIAATLLVAVVGAVVATVFALDATKRATELERVAAFQAAQVGGIDAAQMGSGLRESLLSDALAAMRREGVAEEELAQRTAELNAWIARVSFTDIALQAIEANFFAGTLGAVDEQFADQPLVQARLLQSLGTTMRDVGLFDAALPPNERALEIRRRLLGDDHPDTLTSFYELGALRTRRGELERAEPLLRRALEGRRGALPADHPDIQVSVQWLAYLLHLAGDDEEAIELSRESTERMARIQGGDSAEALTQRAGELWTEGRIAECESYFREALAIYRRELGNDDRTTLVAIRNLADTLLTLGEAAESESLFRESFAGFRRLFGEIHQLTLHSKSALGDALQRQGKRAEAEPLLREALARQLEILGEDHPETVATSRALAALLEAMEG